MWLCGGYLCDANPQQFQLRVVGHTIPSMVGFGKARWFTTFKIC